MKRLGILLVALFAIGTVASWRALATPAPFVNQDERVAQRDEREPGNDREGDRDDPPRDGEEREGDRRQDGDQREDAGGPRDRERGETDRGRRDRDGREANRDRPESSRSGGKAGAGENERDHELRMIVQRLEELKNKLSADHPQVRELQRHLQATQRRHNPPQKGWHEDEDNHDHGHHDGDSRTEHLMVAAEHLHAAGMHELGELVQQHAHASDREPRQLLERIERLEIHVERLTNVIHRFHADDLHADHAHGDFDHPHGDDDDHDHHDPRQHEDGYRPEPEGEEGSGN